MKLLRDDIPFIGLTVLYEPDEPASAVVDIVLIGGLGSHPVQTWTYIAKDREDTEGPEQMQPRTHDVYWPLDLLPKACPNTRILVWGCHSIVMNGKLLQGQDSIFDHAEDLLWALTDFRNETNTMGRAVVFVAHSLGGVIVKEVLRRAEAQPHAQIKDLLESTSGVVFMASPHRATHAWGLGDAVKNMAHLTLGVHPKDPTLAELCGADSHELELGMETFLRLWADYNFRIKTFQEKSVSNQRYGEPRMELRLRREASCLGDSRERADTLDGNHLDMCKFRSEHDVEWRTFADIISRHVIIEVSRLRQLNVKERECLRALEQTSLSPCEHRSTVPYPGTCLWLHDLPEFHDWNHRTPEGSGKVLWIKGPPGSGKTVLLKSLRRYLEKQRGASGAVFLDVSAEGRDLDTVYFLPSQRQQYTPNPARVYRALLARLFHHDPKLRKQIMAIYKKYRSFDDARVVNYFVEDYISSRIDTPAKRTFIFIDANDACGTAYLQDLLHHLATLSQNSDFSIVVASAEHSDVKLVGNKTVDVLVQDNNANDILRYVNLSLTVSVWDDRNRTVNRLTEKAHGVFLWAELAINVLNAAIGEGATPDLVNYTLDQIPGSLSGLYEWLLATLLPEEKQDALALFQWVLLASEPLRLNDLRFAIRVAKSWNPEIFEPGLALKLDKPMSIRELKEPSELAGDSPYQFHRWIRQRSLGLLELRPSTNLPDTGKRTEPLGLQRVYVIHESVRTFFTRGRGYYVLAGAKAASLGQFEDISHFALLNACLTYLNMADFEPLGNASAPRGQTPETSSGMNNPPNLLPSAESRCWRRTVGDQRYLVTSSYPFLRYAVSNVLYHLLSPRAWRFFPPQQQLLALLAADKCRLWKRWTALLGTSEPRCVISASETANDLVGCVSGAGVRLERVFKKLNELVKEEVKAFEAAEGKETKRHGETIKRVPSREKIAGDGSIKRKVRFLIAPLGAESPESAVASSPESAVATGLGTQRHSEALQTGRSGNSTPGKAIAPSEPSLTTERTPPAQPQLQADETCGLMSSPPPQTCSLATKPPFPRSFLLEKEPDTLAVVGRGIRAGVGTGVVSYKASQEPFVSKLRRRRSLLNNPRPPLASPKLSKPQLGSLSDLHSDNIAATHGSLQSPATSIAKGDFTPRPKAVNPKASREKLTLLTTPIMGSAIQEVTFPGERLFSPQEESEFPFPQALERVTSTSAGNGGIAPLESDHSVPSAPKIQSLVASSTNEAAPLIGKQNLPSIHDLEPQRTEKPQDEFSFQNDFGSTQIVDSPFQQYVSLNFSSMDFSPRDDLLLAPPIPKRSAERPTLVATSGRFREQMSAAKQASERAAFEKTRAALLSPTSPQEARRRLNARNRSKKARLPLYKRMHHHTHVREWTGGGVETIAQLKGLVNRQKPETKKQPNVPKMSQTKVNAVLKDTTPTLPTTASLMIASSTKSLSPVSAFDRLAATTPAWEDIGGWSLVRKRSPVYAKSNPRVRLRSRGKSDDIYVVSGANGPRDQSLQQMGWAGEGANESAATEEPQAIEREQEKKQALHIIDPFKLGSNGEVVFLDPAAPTLSLGSGNSSKMQGKVNATATASPTTRAARNATSTFRFPAAASPTAITTTINPSAENRGSFVPSFPTSANRKSFASMDRIRTPASIDSERAFWSPATLLSSPLTEVSEVEEVAEAFETGRATTSVAAAGWSAYGGGSGSRNRQSEYSKRDGGWIRMGVETSEGVWASYRKERGGRERYGAV